MRQNRMLFGLALGVSLLTATSCVDSSFLDETQTTDLTQEVIFGDSTYTVGFLNNIYADQGFDIKPNRFGTGGLQTACDEAEFKLNAGSNDGVRFVSGTINPVSAGTDAWVTCYRNIRAVNVFLANIGQCPMSEMAKTVYIAEARYLRAWYYFLLLRHYGGVPLLGDVVYTNDDIDNINYTRASFADVYNYIIDECNEAAKHLPNRRGGSSFGRAGAGTCMALISRLTLYAASPLYNGTTLTNDERLRPLVGFPEYDENRWKVAADAAKRIIQTGAWQVYSYHKDNTGAAEPGWGFYAQFQGYDFTQLDNYEDKQFTSGAYCGHITTWKRNMGNEREAFSYPATCGGNGNGGYPTLELVESFPMKDGKPALVDGSPTEPKEGDENVSKYAYDRMNPAANRDPRFALSFVWNGGTCFSAGDKSHLVSTFTGFGSTDDAIGKSTRTGFFWRKFGHRDTSGNWFVTVEQTYCLIRYEEILLNYAEAINEFYGPDHTEVIGGQTVGPYDALIMIRERAGIEPGDNGLYGLKSGMSRDEMREAIRLERRIEFAYEGHRFYDVRRWKIAEQTENVTTHGWEISKKLDGSISSRVVSVREHVFSPRMYFWPIPYQEVVRSSDLLQNPYYE